MAGDHHAETRDLNPLKPLAGHLVLQPLAKVLVVGPPVGVANSRIGVVKVYAVAVASYIIILGRQADATVEYSWLRLFVLLVLKYKAKHFFY